MKVAGEMVLSMSLHLPHVNTFQFLLASCVGCCVCVWKRTQKHVKIEQAQKDDRSANKAYRRRRISVPLDMRTVKLMITLTLVKFSQSTTFSRKSIDDDESV
jgi:hypothetical protein